MDVKSEVLNLTKPPYHELAWGKIYGLFGENDMLMFSVGTWMVVMTTYWVVNLSLLYIDLTGKPKILSRYKVQPDKNAPLDPALLSKLFKTTFINMMLITPLATYGWYLACKWRGISCGYDVPSVSRIFLDIVVAIIGEEIFFYYSHRIIHHYPYLYKRIHKIHHEWTAPIGMTCIYAHPVEHILSNIMPLVSGPFLFKTHLLSTWIWAVIGLVGTSIHHSGYHFPLTLSPEFHDFHHAKFHYNFGLLGILDWLHGTDALFRKSIAFKRNKILFGLTPLSDSIPEKNSNGNKFK
ncbi:fatty acid hydroxylase domain-containing protein 2-like [Glandiceps talaboti]